MDSQEEQWSEGDLSYLGHKQTEKDLILKQQQLELRANEIELQKQALELEKMAIDIRETEQESQLTRKLKSQREKRLSVGFYVANALAVINLIAGCILSYEGLEIGYVLLANSGTISAVNIARKTSPKDPSNADKQDTN